MSVVYNPWGNHFSLPTINSKITIQVTPNNSKTLDFNYKKNSNGKINLITLNKNVNSGNGYDHINISVKDTKGYINQISRTSIHSGTSIMKLALKILQKMGVTECELKDTSTFLCNINKNGIKQKVNMNYKIIMLLKHEQTYYMKFGFKPISQKNTNRGKNMSNKLKDEINKIRECSWKDLDTFMNHTEIFMNKNRLYSSLFNKALHNWNEFKTYYQRIYSIYPLDGPFHAFKDFRNETCHLFTTWFHFYINVATNNFELYSTIINIELFKNCKFESLKNIYEELLVTKWINSDIQTII